MIQDISGQEQNNTKTALNCENFADTYQVDASEAETSEEVEQVDVAKLSAKQIKFSNSHPLSQKRGNSDFKLGQWYVKTVSNPKQTLTIDYRPNKEVR